LWIDLAGAAVLAACAFAFIYLTFYQGGHTAAELGELKGLIKAAGGDLADAQAARERQRASLKSQQAELAAGGQLPTQVSLEAYFQRLSRLAQDHHIRVVRQNPLSSRQYPGLLEQRCAYEVMGSMPDLARFFSAVETEEAWADIGFLKITNAESGPNGVDADRLASLTISLFTASKVDAAATGGG